VQRDKTSNRVSHDIPRPPREAMLPAMRLPDSPFGHPGLAHTVGASRQAQLDLQLHIRCVQGAVAGGGAARLRGSGPVGRRRPAAVAAGACLTRLSGYPRETVCKIKARIRFAYSVAAERCARVHAAAYGSNGSCSALDARVCSSMQTPFVHERACFCDRCVLQCCSPGPVSRTHAHKSQAAPDLHTPLLRESRAESRHRFAQTSAFEILLTVRLQIRRGPCRS